MSGTDEIIHISYVSSSKFTDKSIKRLKNLRVYKWEKERTNLLANTFLCTSFDIFQ
jgi:hypothetical protein